MMNYAMLFEPVLVCSNPRAFYKTYELSGYGLADDRTQLKLLRRMLMRAEMHGKGGAGSQEWKRYRREVKRLENSG